MVMIGLYAIFYFPWGKMFGMRIFYFPWEALEPITVEILHSNSHLETTQQLKLTSCTGLAHKLKVEMS